jgi:hypothetical protein
MLELIGAAVLAVLAGRGLWWWIHHDGPIRLFAGLIAVGHTDETRRRDAREVLGATKNLRSTQKFHRRATTPPGGESKSGLRATATDPPAIARLDRQGPAVPQGAASARSESAPRRPRHRLITKDSRLLPAARPSEAG